jgi:hypothetical protein
MNVALVARRARTTFVAQSFGPFDSSVGGYYVSMEPWTWKPVQTRHGRATVIAARQSRVRPAHGLSEIQRDAESQEEQK